ncbi:MAG: RHS repeat-associated core domain-containing protein [Candidatus Nitrotoga sp.]
MVTITKYVWDTVSDCVLSELDENNAVKAVYTNEPQQYGGVLSQRRGTTSHYHHHDALGSTRFLTDSSGNVTDTYLHDAWGNEVASTGSTVNPFKWVGKYGYYTDNSTGQVYVRARMYQPTVARWVSMDPIFPVGLLYTYCDQTPNSWLDPSGLFPSASYAQDDSLISLPGLGSHGGNPPCGKGPAISAGSAKDGYCFLEHGNIPVGSWKTVLATAVDGFETQQGYVQLHTGMCVFERKVVSCYKCNVCCSPLLAPPNWATASDLGSITERATYTFHIDQVFVIRDTKIDWVPDWYEALRIYMELIGGPELPDLSISVFRIRDKKLQSYLDGQCDIKDPMLISVNYTPAPDPPKLFQCK